MKTKTYLALIVIFLLSASGCALVAQDIADVKDEELVGTNVIVSGTVEDSIKLGELSGFIIRDDTGEIAVSSQSIPETGERVTVQGELKRTLGVYFIESE